MRVKKQDGPGVRRVLAAMIMDRIVCGRVASQWPADGGGLFDAPWANLVGGWCVDHMRKFGEPLRGDVRSVYEGWVTTTRAPEETVEGVARFLRAAEEEWDREDGGKINSDYLLDEAGRYFNAVRMKEAITRAEELMESGKVNEAEALLSGIRRVQLGAGSFVKVFNDWDAWRDAFDEERERPLLHYPGRLQEFLGRWMQRDTLIGFMAPDKTGKSVFLMDLAVRAVKGRCRVVYFDVGDNSQKQVLQRLGSRVANHPGKENFKSSTVVVPVSLVKGEGNEYEVVETKVRTFSKPLSSSDAYRAATRMCRGVDRLRVSCHPNGTASMSTIFSVLSDWEQQDGWTPDVVVIDYADILAPPPGVRETLDQIDETWKQLRRLSQERHCLVVTATQSSSAAYNDKASVLRKQHFSGRKTKLAHVNGMVGINSSASNRRSGITGLNWIVRREGRYDENVQMMVAGCWEWYDPARCVAE